MNQEDSRKKWLEAENELMRLQHQLSDVRKMNSKLELQYHHATVLLKSEIKVRTQVQEEKKGLVRALTCFYDNMLNYLFLRRHSHAPIIFILGEATTNCTRYCFI